MFSQSFLRQLGEQSFKEKTKCPYGPMRCFWLANKRPKCKYVNYFYFLHQTYNKNKKKASTILVRFWKLPERTRIVLDRTTIFKNVLKLIKSIHVERTRLVRSSTQKIVVRSGTQEIVVRFFTFLILRLSYCQLPGFGIFCDRNNMSHNLVIQPLGLSNPCLLIHQDLKCKPHFWFP